MRTPLADSLDKSLQQYDSTHILQLNWIWELPFGPNKRWLSSSPGISYDLAAVLESETFSGGSGGEQESQYEPSKEPMHGRPSTVSSPFLQRGARLHRPR